MEFEVFCNVCSELKKATQVTIHKSGIMETELECGHWAYFDTAKYMGNGEHLSSKERIGLPVERRVRT